MAGTFMLAGAVGVPGNLGPFHDLASCYPRDTGHGSRFCHLQPELNYWPQSALKQQTRVVGEKEITSQ